MAKARAQRQDDDDRPDAPPLHEVVPMGTTGVVEMTCRNEGGNKVESRYQMEWKRGRKTQQCLKCGVTVAWPADAGEPGRRA